MENLLKMTFVLALLLPAQVMASVTIFNSADTQLGHFDKLKYSTNFTTTAVGGKAVLTLTQNPLGLAQNLISTSGDLTQANCGSTVVSTLARSKFNLPSISNDVAIGCRYTFVVLTQPTYGTDQGLHVDVKTLNEKILQLTDTLGDSISADLPGDSITLEAVSNSSTNGYSWAPVAINGSWVDTNTN